MEDLKGCAVVQVPLRLVAQLHDTTSQERRGRRFPFSASHAAGCVLVPLYRTAHVILEGR